MKALDLAKSVASLKGTSQAQVEYAKSTSFALIVSRALCCDNLFNVRSGYPGRSFRPASLHCCGQADSGGD